MPRQSALQAFLNKYPEARRIEIEQQIRSAPTIKQAHQELKKLRYKGSYDSVQFWRANDAKGRIENIQFQASSVSAHASQLGEQLSEGDPIEMLMNLSRELTLLCNSLTTLIQRHEWLEPGEIRLSNREASKILAALPSLARASAGTLLEMTRVRGELDQKAFALGVFAEIKEDWYRTLAHDNPELLPVLESVLAVTKARLELDRPSLLEDRLK